MFRHCCLATFAPRSMRRNKKLRRHRKLNLPYLLCCCGNCWRGAGEDEHFVAHEKFATNFRSIVLNMSFKINNA